MPSGNLRSCRTQQRDAFCRASPSSPCNGHSDHGLALDSQAAGGATPLGECGIEAADCRRPSRCMICSFGLPVTVARHVVYQFDSQTPCSFSNSPGLPRGLFGTGFEAISARAARTFLRTFWQFAARGAPLSAHFVPMDPLGSDFAPISKQSCVGLGNLGCDRAAESPVSNNLFFAKANSGSCRVSWHTTQSI